MNTVMQMPFVPEGQYKSIGDLGPKYLVGRLLRQLDDGDWMVEVTLIETDEITEYRLSHLNNDPKAA